MQEKKKITLERAVDSYRSGWTVVEFLAHRFRYHTSERWTKRVNDGWVQVNGVDVEPEHVVNKDDVISYTIWHAEPEVDFRFDVVHEDDHILAVSKSGNIPVHACGVYIQSTLIATLKNIYGDHLNLAHRLDRETSGLVLLTKNPGAARVLGKMFADGKVEKTYIAVVRGVVVADAFEVDAPIGKTMEESTGRFNDDRMYGDLNEDLPRYVPRRFVDPEGGKPAVTKFEVVERKGGFTVVRALPLSGRTNQIRVHLEHIGHPIVGDKVYGPRDLGPAADGTAPGRAYGPAADETASERVDGTATGNEGRDAAVSDALPIERQALHCCELRFEHPITHEMMRVSADIPGDLSDLISKLPVA